MRRHGWILALLFGSSLLAAPLAATEAVLGSAGELYAVRAGTYRALFPEGAAVDLYDHAVLALDVVRPGQATQRLLVPGTEGEEFERLPSLIFEEASNTVYLVWEKRTTPIHPVLMLSGYEDGEWIEPVEVIGNYFADKTSPQIALTHETYSNSPSIGAGAQPPAVTHRSIVHVVWGEEIVVTGLYETFYTALLFENGSYIGKSPVYNLNQLDTGNGPATAFETAANLVRAPRLASGRDERTVAVAFASATTRHMVSLEIDVLPAQLSRLADDARAYIIDIGRRATGASTLRSMADEARAYIIDIGVAFQPEVRRSIGELVHTFIRTSGRPLDPNAIRSLADDARAYIIDIGAKLSGRGLQTITAAATTPTIREVDLTSLTQGAGERRPPVLFQFRVASSRPAPRVGGGEINVFVSKSGSDVLIAWQETGKVLYRESSGEGWSDTLELRLSPSLDLRRAYEMLEQRVRNR